MCISIISTQPSLTNWMSSPEDWESQVNQRFAVNLLMSYLICY